MNAEVLIKFKGDTSSADSATKKMSTSLGQLAKSFALGNLAAKGITKAIQVFNSGLDGAISRSDTLKNFPKVMSNLGIGTDEASSAMSTLSEKLQGLPTSLDSAAMSVQRLTSKNGNVEDSTKIFLALNNAILAGGASAETQASALEQISQAYAKGKPDMMEWRSIMTAMPAQLKQVATAMGYVDADALGSALREGSASMDDFMNTIVKLNETGIEGFANFDTQARNATGGIATSITNMKTAFTRGIANIISSVDKALEPFGGLAGVISNIGVIGEKMFSAIGQGIAMVLPSLVTLFQTIMPPLQQLMATIMPILTNIFNTIMPVIIQALNMILPPLVQIISAILPPLLSLLQPILNLLQPILNLIQPLINVVMTLLEPLIELIGMILPPLVDLLSQIAEVILPILTFAFEQAGKIISGVFKAAIDNIRPLIENVKGIFKGLTDFIGGVFTGNWSRAWEGVKSIFSNIAQALGNIFKAPINFIIDLINVFIRGLNKIEIPDWVPAVGGMGFHIPELPKLATGTNFVPEDTLAMIHKGEAVVPKKFNPYANGMSNSTIGTMQNNNPRPIINVYADFEMDPIGQVVSNIKTFSGGAKNDYNYGQGV